MALISNHTRADAPTAPTSQDSSASAVSYEIIFVGILVVVFSKQLQEFGNFLFGVVSETVDEFGVGVGSHHKFQDAVKELLKLPLSLLLNLVAWCFVIVGVFLGLPVLGLVFCWSSFWSSRFGGLLWGCCSSEAVLAVRDVVWLGPVRVLFWEYKKMKEGDGSSVFGRGIFLLFMYDFHVY